MIAVRRFALWRGSVVAVSLLSLATLVAWIWLVPAPHSIAGRLAVALLALAIPALAGSLMRMPPVELRWDGSVWSRRDLAVPLSPPTEGELVVALDLGSFLLLRFTSLTVEGRRAVRWIPVERHGHEREWHSFRCAVYSPRPGAGTAGAAASPPS